MDEETGSKPLNNLPEATWMLCEINVKIQHNLVHTAAHYLCTESGDGSRGVIKINRDPILPLLSSGAIAGEGVQGSKRMRKSKASFSMHT